MNPAEAQSPGLAGIPRGPVGPSPVPASSDGPEAAALRLIASIDELMAQESICLRAGDCIRAAAASSRVAPLITRLGELAAAHPAAVATAGFRLGSRRQPQGKPIHPGSVAGAVDGRKGATCRGEQPREKTDSDLRPANFGRTAPDFERGGVTQDVRTQKDLSRPTRPFQLRWGLFKCGYQPAAARLSSAGTASDALVRPSSQSEATRCASVFQSIPGLA